MPRATDLLRRAGARLAAARQAPRPPLRPRRRAGPRPAALPHPRPQLAATARVAPPPSSDRRLCQGNARFCRRCGPHRARLISDRARARLGGRGWLGGGWYALGCKRTRWTWTGPKTGSSTRSSPRCVPRGPHCGGGALLSARGREHKLTISTSGNVGIGKTNPAYKLDVNGLLQCTGVALPPHVAPLLGLRDLRATLLDGSLAARPPARRLGVARHRQAPLAPLRPRARRDRSAPARPTARPPPPSY